MGAQKRYLIILFCSSLCVRLGLFFYFTWYGRNAWVYVDSDQYHQLALSFLNTGCLSLNPDGLLSYRLPGYPLFLSFWYWLVGINQTIPLVFQIICASIIPCLLYLLSIRLFPSALRVARYVGWLACFHVGFVLYAGMLATESFFVLFFLLFLLFFLPGKYAKKRLFYAGICLGCAALFRPLGLFLLITSCLLLLCSQNFLLERIKKCALLCGGWLIIVTPWLVRNALLFGAPFFHSLPGLHFLQYPATRVIASVKHIAYPTARQHVLEYWDRAIKQKETTIKRSLNEYEKCCVGEKQAFSFLFSHPVYALQDATKELFKTIFGLYSAIILIADNMPWPEYTEQTPWQKKVKRFLVPHVRRPLLVGIIYLDIAMLIFMLFGFFLFLFRVLRRREMVDIFLKIIPFIIVLIGVTSAYGGARLRMPADIFLLLGAVYGFLPRHKTNV